MKKLILVTAVAIGLSGCATTQSMTPCEKALLAKIAAEKVFHYVCPLAEPAVTEGVY